MDRTRLIKNLFSTDKSHTPELIKSGVVDAEDFMYMTDSELETYLPYVISYLHSAGSAKHWEFARFIISSLAFEHKHVGLSRKAFEYSRSIANYIIHNFEKFDIFYPDDFEESDYKVFEVTFPASSH